MTTRILISLPAEHARAFSDAADAKGKSLSEFLRDAGLAKLPKEVRAKLPVARKRGRPPTAAAD